MMSDYNPEIKIYYGSIDNESNRVLPAPDISISLEYNYANDTIIGYTYVINLTGFVTALDLRNTNTLPANPNYNLGAVVDHMNKLRNLLSQNGRILNIVRSSDDSIILKAKGGILRSLSFDESSNNWKNYAAYTASIEFHSVDFVSHTEDCGSIFLDPSTHPSGTAGIVDINQFKIKTFQDSWNISFNENEAFNKENIQLNIDNRSFNIQYSISATGKHFFDYDNESTGSSKLLPAWEQAKNFVQYRLYSQVMALLNGVLKNTYNSSCASNDNQTNINTPVSSGGLLEDIHQAEYGVFNETISCEASESDGTFSATYNAVVKNLNTGNPLWTHSHCTHTVNKNINYSYNMNVPSINISINGTIQGLEEGGIIRPGVHLSLPSNGSLFVYNGSSSNKYNNAKILLDKIYRPNGLIKDLDISFKNALGTVRIEELDQSLYPISFNLTHDYNNGNINYNVEYSNTNCENKYKEISIQLSQPTKVIAVFNRPNSNATPMIQELGTYTAKTVSITVNGVNLNDEVPSIESFLPSTLNNIITQKQLTQNPLDKSYSINISYICGTGGCS